MKEYAWVYGATMLLFAVVKYTQLIKGQKSKGNGIAQIIVYLSIFTGYFVNLLDGVAITTIFHAVAVLGLIMALILEALSETEEDKFSRFMKMLFFAIPIFVVSVMSLLK